MKLFFSIIFSCPLINWSFCQQQVPCTELDSVMAIIKEGSTELATLYDKQVLFDCGDFDEVDRILLFGNFLDNFMAANLVKHDTLTYSIMMKELKEVQTSPAYRESYEISKTRMMILNSIADTVLFDQYIQTFTDFFPNQEERNYVRNYVGEHQNDTLSFIGILEQYTAEESTQLSDEAPPAQYINQVPFYAFYDLKTTLENAIYYERPFLLYFSGYTNVNSRKIEASWFNEARVNELMNQMTVYQAMCDESLAMDPTDIKYFKKKYKKSFKTYGEKNAFIQQKEFNASNQPYFVLYASNGKKIASYSSIGNIEEFIIFLKQANY